MVTIESTLALAEMNRRVCPLPVHWSELYDMLPETRRVGNGWEPASPLILAAWSHTTASMKMLRMREHIEWAAEHGCLLEVHTFLSRLPESDWHHSSD